MKTLLFLLLLGSSILPGKTGAQLNVDSFFTKAMSQINIKHVTWIKNTAKEMNAKELAPGDILSGARNYAVSGSLAGQDIEALAFLVLMQAAKSAQEDLKAIMAQVKGINKDKARMRDALTQLEKGNASISRAQLDSFKLLLPRNVRVTTVSSPRTTPVSKAEVNDLTTKMKNEHDSLHELGQEQQLKMQLLTERMNKSDSAASNLLKKFSDSANAIIQNMK